MVGCFFLILILCAIFFLDIFICLFLYVAFIFIFYIYVALFFMYFFHIIYVDGYDSRMVGLLFSVILCSDLVICIGVTVLCRLWFKLDCELFFSSDVVV